MQKNEGPLLFSWLTYHISLFGAESIYLFDNMSSDFLTIECLDWAEAQGATIIRNCAEFEKKGVLVTDAIKQLAGKYDWFFPLDADEFITKKNGNLVSGKPEDIFEEINRMDKTKLVRIPHYFWNIPYSSDGYYTPAKKVMVPSGFNVKLDIGFHLFSWEKSKFGDTIDSALLQPTELCYLHFHNKPFPRVLDAARMKLAARLKGFTRNELNEYKGAGNHLCKYFLMSEVDYMEGFTKKEVTLNEAFASHGLSVPFLNGWDEASAAAKLREKL